MKRQTAFALLLAMSTVLSAPNVMSQVRLETPAENQAPFYARLLRSVIDGIHFQEIYHNDQWAAIPFYRNPECVPADFNLLEFFDFTPDPDFGLRAFGCPVTVQGFELWSNGLGIDEAPYHAQLSGLGAVPVWFVSWPDLQGAVQDGLLTIGDLTSMPSLRKGVATFFSEVLQPFPSAQVTSISLRARGSTEDGARFFFQAAASGPARICCSSNDPEDPRQHVQIRFW